MEEDADGSHVLPASQLAVATALLPMLTGGVLTPQATTLLLTLPPSNTKKNKWGLRGIRFDDRKKAKKWEVRFYPAAARARRGRHTHRADMGAARSWRGALTLCC
ncbi:MAG: hypothetical protein EOO65_04885 [Methanosarcinales archaeon]|nr:MAG: hypothetical protein EOO65_04885 [Methanosarcinales archaeon]